jgi:hypothetical protein
MDINEIDGQEIFNHMENLCNFGYRRAGTKAALKGEEYIFQELKKAGVSDVQKEEFKFRQWWPEKYSLKVINEGISSVSKDTVIESFPVWLSGSTEPEGITAELVYAQNGTSVDIENTSVENKIVLVDGKMILNFNSTLTSRVFDTLEILKEKGALGMICTHGSPLDLHTYVRLMSIHGWKRRLPALSINNMDGLYLKTLCLQNKRKVKVNLVQSVKAEKAKSNIIIGTLSGQSDDIILIGTHTDSTFTGAMDNAAANGGLIAMAKYFADIPQAERKKTLKFVGWTGHETALTGVSRFVKTHQAMLEKIAPFIMLDGLASNGYYNQADGGVVKTGSDEKRGLFITDNAVLTPIVIDAVLKYKLLPAAYISANTLPVSDLGPFVFSKVPSIMIIGKSVYYHTKEDTAEKVPPERLERATKAHIEIIENLMDTPTDKIKQADRKLENLQQFIENKEGIEAPSGFFDVVPYPVPVGFKAIFHPTVFYGPESVVLDFEWDFGDGTTSDMILTRHAYEKPGLYDVKFSIMDNFGTKGSIKRTIRVIER